MAVSGDKAEKQLREITECSICMSTFTDPRMLPCIHTFCFKCLKSTGEAEQKKPGDKMPCPLCRKEFIIPLEGMVGLQRNFFMENLLEFKATLQNNPATFSIGAEIKEEVKRMSNVKNCNQHHQKPLDYYCAECKIVVCVSCFVENHKLHDCKDVTTVEENFRQTIRRAAWKASNYADEMLSLRKHSEMIKTDFLRKLEEVETKIMLRNQHLKDMIDKHTHSLLDELTEIKSRNLKDMENQLEEINRCCTILRSFESYCNEINLHGSASDICSSVDQLVSRAIELEKDHDAFIGRPREYVDVSFQTTDLEDSIHNLNENLLGNIEVRAKTKMQSENFAVVVRSGHEVIKVNLQLPNDISSLEHTPFEIELYAVADVYCNTMYVTGVGENSDEIWKYNYASGWMNCASLVGRRRCHSAAFIDDVLYICGGWDATSHEYLDTVEAYDAISDKCAIVGKLVHGVTSYGNCAPFKSSIYVFGSHRDRVNYVQVYNTKENKCSVLSRLFPGECFKMRAVFWDTSVILLGTDSCSVFNIETETWQEINRLKTDIYWFGLVLENEKVFVIGNKEVRYIPLKTILNNEPIGWKVHATLSENLTPKHVYSCVKMRFLV